MVNKTKYFVKAWQEDESDDFYVVEVPNGTNQDVVHKNLRMASMYVAIFNGYDGNREEYDSHYEEIVNLRTEKLDWCGVDVFNYYLEKICGYKVKKIECDFSYNY